MGSKMEQPGESDSASSLSGCRNVFMDKPCNVAVVASSASTVNISSTSSVLRGL